MANILAFAGSNSSTSINFSLVEHTVSLVENHRVEVMDLSLKNFSMYSEDLEKDQGHPATLKQLAATIKSTDGLILSVNEHNGNPSAFFKNVLDWLSRIDREFLKDTKVFLMATSPGKRGAVSSLRAVSDMLPRFGATVVHEFSLPSFHQNFNAEHGIVEEGLRQRHEQLLQGFLQALK